jgi:hypothetical protein
VGGRHWWHSWKTIRETGCHLYQKCACGKRRIKSLRGASHQPIDTQWVESGEFREQGKPVQGDLGAAPAKRAGEDMSSINTLLAALKDARLEKEQ